MAPGPDLSAETRAVLDATACGVVQTNPQGMFLRVNRTFCSWLGYAPEELIGRRRFQDLLTVGGRIFHQTHWLPLMQIQGSVAEVKLELAHRDGATSIPVVLNALRHEDHGMVVHEIAAFVARDRDKYERELLLSRTRLEELVLQSTQLQAEAKDRALLAEQMIGIVSHDLRNPLSSIMMSTAILQRGEPSSAQSRTVTRINRSAERAKWLISDLLDFTQARLGKGLTANRTGIDLHAVVSESVDELSAIYSGRVLQQVRSGAGPCQGDANRLAQLVGNLVSNAMTYGSPTEPVTATSTIETGFFSIAVHNLGPPLPDSVRARLFQPMTRGTDVASEARSLGLGLFIVQEIAKAHGGTVEVVSSAEEGTTFRASIPRRESAHG